MDEIGFPKVTASENGERGEGMALLGFFFLIA